MSDFSVIIPTLQRAKELHELVEMCAAHPRVLEVLVINNAPEPLAWESPKARVLQQAENIYVNPAWNLGAREARGKYLAILNDDIDMQAGVLDYAAKVLRRGVFGILGPDPSCFTGSPDGRISHRPAPTQRRFFGTAMFLRRGTYSPIPEDMLIWGGDDWLINSSPMPPAVLIGARFKTDMSATTRSREFQRLWERNWEVSRRRLGRMLPEGIGRGDVPVRWWHPLRRPYLIAQRARGALRR